MLENRERMTIYLAKDIITFCSGAPFCAQPKLTHVHLCKLGAS